MTSDQGSPASAAQPGPAPLSADPRRILPGPGGPLASFVTDDDPNLDWPTVESFSQEWERFGEFSDTEIEDIGREYFADLLPDSSLAGLRVLDVGCGSGRWTRYFAARAGFVEAADPGRAALIAQRATTALSNVRVVQASVESLPYAPATFDVVVSVGVLHHLPDPAAAIARLASLIRPGGRLFLYIYYNLDDRSLPYRAAFAASQLLRRVISRLPARIKIGACEIAAVVVYLPLILTARAIRKLAPGQSFHLQLPLLYYVNKPWRVVRNDALDRLGTPLELRFSRNQIVQMLRAAKLGAARFGSAMPRWRVVAEQPRDPSAP